MLSRILYTYKVSFSGLSRESWLLSLVILINRSGTMAATFMSIYVTQALQRSIADAGWIITLFGVGAVAGSALGGYLTDKIGFRRVQIFTSITSGVLFILFGQTDHYPLLCTIAVGLGCISEAFRPANFTAIAAYSTPQSLTRSYSLNRLAVNIGWGLGSTTGGILASIDYRLLFWVEGIVYVLVGILIYFLLPPVQIHRKTRPVDKAAGSDSPWADAFFVRFLLLSLVFITCFFLVFRLVPVYWKEVKHIGEATIGLILGTNGLLIAMFEMVLVQYCQNKRTKQFYIILGIFMTILGYVFFLFSDFAPVLIAFLAVGSITVGEMFALPFINTIVVERANEHNRGRYSAAYTLVWAVAQIIGPAGGAYVAEKGSYTLLWLLLIVLCFAAAFGIRYIFRRQPDLAPSQVQE